MKKILALTLAFAMTTSLLVGCGNKPQNETSSSAGQTSSSEVTPASEVSASAGSEADGSAPADSAGSADDSVTPVRGIWNDNTWQSDYADLIFTLPEGWSAVSDADIASTMQLAADSMGEQGEALTDAMLEESAIYDMMTLSDTGSNVIVGMENLTAGHPLGGYIGSEAYLDAVKEQVEQATPGAYTFSEVSSQKIGDNTYDVMDADFSQDGVTGTQRYLVRKIGNYILFVIVTAGGGDTTGDITANFAAVQ